jgi:hypothetical protein
MKKFLFFIIFFILITINISEANEDKRIKVIIKQSINSYINNETYILIESLKDDADKLIFNHSLNPNTITTFVDNYYSEVKFENTFKARIEDYLIKDSNVRNFIIDSANKIEKHVVKIYENILENIVKEEGTLSIAFTPKSDYISILEMGLPTAKEMTNDIYKDIVLEGHTLSNENELREMYKEYRERYPKSTMTVEAFIVISSTALCFYTGGTYAIILSAGAGVITSAIFWDLESTHFRAKIALENTLKDSISKRRNEFHDNISVITKKIIKSMTKELKEILKTVKFKPNTKINFKKIN